jgi:hypothetical protein
MLLRVIQSEAGAAGRVDWSVSVDSSRMAPLSTTFEPAFLKRVKNVSFRRTRRAAASRGGARPQRTIIGKENTRSSPFLIYTAPGGLRQAPGRAA